MSKVSVLLENGEFKEMLGKENDVVVARRFGCSKTDVFYARLALHIEPCRKHSTHSMHRNNIDNKALLKEYEELGTLQKVAEKHGISKQAVSQRLGRVKEGAGD